MSAAVRALRKDGKDELAELVTVPGAMRLLMRRGPLDWWADLVIGGRVVCSIDLRQLGIYDVDGELLILDQPM